MADAMDSKSIVGNNVWVQVPPPAPKTNLIARLDYFYCKRMPFHHILGLPKIFNFWEKGVKVRKGQTFEKKLAKAQFTTQWQTRWTQNPLLATTCGFKSHHLHQTEYKGASCALSSCFGLGYIRLCMRPSSSHLKGRNLQPFCSVW